MYSPLFSSLARPSDPSVARSDQGYTGTLVRWAEQEYGWRVQVVYPQLRQLERYASEVLAELGHVPGFRMIPRRWVVERTFSWLGRQRRLSKDYERLAMTAEALLYLASIRLLRARFGVNPDHHHRPSARRRCVQPGRAMQGILTTGSNPDLSRRTPQVALQRVG
jgi:transposase